MKPLFLGAASLLALAALPATAEEGFYQHPAASGDVLVFASEGDLWRSARGGGSAIRLTNHEGEESEPHISPDGTLIAFTASYDSDRDVYVMPVAGGRPQRVTFEGGFVRTIGWTPDGRVVFSSAITGGGQGEVLHTVDPAGGAAQPVPLWRANDATWGADGRTLFVTRRGLYARARDNAVLYRGGGMEQLWRWDGGAEAEAVQLLADFGAPIRMPMAHGGRIWFVSDKSGKDAVWSVAEDGSDVRRMSDELPFPVLQAYQDGGEIFLQNGADLHVFSADTGELRTLGIDLVTDREQTRVRALEDPLRWFESARIAPSGEGVAVTARGRTTLAAPGQLRRVELPVPLAARARQAVPMPDGKRVMMILDSGDRGDIVAMPADGTGTPTPITKGYDAHIWSFAIAPDGKTIVLWDKEARLQKVDVATGRVTLLARNATGSDDAFFDLAFAPDSSHIAYAEAGTTNGGNTADIILQNLATGQRVQATSGKYNSYAPAFAHDGAWLYFLSDRNFTPSPGAPWGDRNMGPAFRERGEAYALQLDPKSGFRMREDNELTRTAEPEAATEASETAAPEDSADKASKGKDKGTKADKAKANIVLDGVAERLYKLPVKPGVEGFLLATEKFLYTRRGDDLVSVAIDKKDPREEVFAPGARGMELSADRETALILGGPNDKPQLWLVPAAAKQPDKPGPHQVRLGDWRLTIDPRAEWRQMFVDAWRLHRDFLYDPALRGVDWNAVRAAREPFLDRIGSRAELDVVLGEMASQIGILHSQVRGGEVRSDRENPAMAFLGATVTPVESGLRIDSILRAEADLVDLRPPLRRPGVDVREGDVIRMVDGRAVASHADLQNALAAKAGQQVRLDLTRAGRRLSAIVEPMTLDGNYVANYRDWVEAKRAATAQLSGGQIGYLHLRAMGPNDLASFARDYFPLLEKPGLIIDVRGNSGGNIDSFIVAMLLRRAWAFWSEPDGSGIATTNMQNAYRGHVAVLIDERTYSDGETFAAAIKALGIAPLVGTRTAGAGIWLSDRNSLADRGMVRAAENAQYAIDGRWIVEGRGVSPDREVENLPHATFEGSDAQLEAAVGLLTETIAREPVPALVPQPLPRLGTPGGDVTRPRS
ncbi:S41 family peptidase [Porphyrobacter sp. YT40]|uniref:S41 family peptidase n=1 Tax=Porphyrobacter sp. YT40 TaxID=2547601 RepID=UPI00114284F2|nr:S41 family peptidase [Porphyrobacter sp. YT40]QDH35758.1 PDZ domain-containing protein [Porphyrobacter sp. YT40]